MRCDSCDLLHLPICSGEADPAHCAPGHPRRHAASKYLSSRMGWPARQSTAPAKRHDVVRVGFWSPVLMPIGGTETFHKTLLPRLANDSRIDLKALAVQLPDRCDHGAKLGCPLVTGEKALRALAESVDVLVIWGVPDPGRYLQPKGSTKRPLIVAVSHDDDGKRWFLEVMAASQSDLDRFVAVDQVAVGSVPPARSADVTVIPNAVDGARVSTDRDRAEIRESLGLGPGDVAVLYLARLSEEKNPRKTIEAVSRMPAFFKLLVAGDGPEAQACAELARGNPRIKLLGKRHDVAELLRASDLFVSMSRSEGFGLSVAEAILAGVPVIGTAVGFLAHSPELARIVEVDADAQRWAEQLYLDWIDAEGRARRAETARGAIEARYDVSTHVDRWASFLHGLGTVRRRAAKPRVELGRPHCAPCQAGARVASMVDSIR